MELPSERRAQHFALSVLIGSLSAAVVGVLTHGFIKAVLFSPWVVAVSLLGGFAILAIERLVVVDEAASPSIERVGYGTAFKIGLPQTLAAIPSVSRLGATIMGARLIGVDPPTVAEFSFFLAIPTMLGATIFDLYKNRMSLEGSGVLVIAIGFATALYRRPAGCSQASHLRLAPQLHAIYLVSYRARHRYVHPALRALKEPTCRSRSHGLASRRLSRQARSRSSLVRRTRRQHEPKLTCLIIALA